MLRVQRDCEVLNSALRIFLNAVEQHLRTRSPGAGPKARTSAVVFIHRFGSALNEHTHFARPILGTRPLPWGLTRKSAPGGFFSLDASVRIEAQNRQGVERLLRYCVRPPFAANRLEEIDAQRLIYCPCPSPARTGAPSSS